MKCNLNALLIIICLTSCQFQRKDKMEQIYSIDPKSLKCMTILPDSTKKVPLCNRFMEGGMDFNHADFIRSEPRMLIDAINALKNCGFKFPDENFFKRKVNEVFKMKIDDYNDNILALRYDLMPEIAVNGDNFILLFNGNKGSGDSVDLRNICHYNNLIFYEETKEIAWFKMNSPSFINDLVIEYGYTGNKDFLNYAFSKLDFLNENSLVDLMFDLVLEENKEFLCFRYDMMDKIVELNPPDGFTLLTSLIDLMIKNPEEYDNPEKAVAYIMDASCKAGVWGNAGFVYDMYPEWRKKLQEKNYYNLKNLTEYSEKFYDEDKQRQHKVGWEEAIINDPDGYINIHKDPNAKSEVIFKIYKDQTFLVFVVDNKDWWSVDYKSQRGYIHKSRVSLK